ncbi:MAG TPA: DNA polymerase III [Oxalobacteraceae bacterium]|nr:DNA polymerase III [Oxalobacteraceae bacterium]
MTFQDSRRVRFLQEIGVGPLWRLRERQPVPADAAASAFAEAAAPALTVGRMAAPVGLSETAAPEAAVPEAVAPGPGTAGIAQKVAFSLEPSMAEPAPVSASWDDAVPDWVTEEAPFAEHMPAAAPEDIPASMPGKPSAGEIAVMDWVALEAAVASCTKCRLCEGRTRTVFGTGDRRAKWLFVGEGPGYNEDLQGEPFVGPAGKLLDNMLAAMDLRRGDNAYIANVVKCRPTGDNGRDRPPVPDEAAACLPYLQRQIALLQPDVIVALGKSAALALLQAAPETPVAKLRGQVHRYAEVPLVVTYHPAYLLRSPEDKAKAWRDLCLAMATHADAATRS